MISNYWNLAATSWLWPDTLRENLDRIGKWDLPIRQVALLFYQYAPSLQYTPEDFATPLVLSAHAHLPIDLPWEAGPRKVWDIVSSLMALPRGSLSPWGGVLHPPKDPNDLDGLARLWREANPGWRLMIENVPGRDLRDHWKVIESRNLPLCLDVGHLMAFDQHWLLDAPGLADRIELIHCYAPGVEKMRHEHLPLGMSTPSQLDTLRCILEMIRPNTPILFEVFAESDLRDCLETFYSLIKGWRLPA